MNENTRNTALRVIDASFNRAMEGLRVVEEFTRMHLADRFLSGRLKNQRHHLAAAISQYFADQLLLCRDILNDVGTEIQTVSEYERANLNQIVRANFSRTLQSLRSIEEYSKLVRPESSTGFEQIRYSVYALEKAVVNIFVSSDQLNNATVYVLVDKQGSFEEFESLIRQLVDAQVDLIQLRDKRLDDRELVATGRLLSELVRSSPTRWIMNDRPDLAVLCEADGVHLGQDDLDVPAARRIIGTDKIIGVSTHQFEQAEAAVMDGASYIGVGPVFPSQTKSFSEFAASEFIERVIGELAIPAFCIGGINEENVTQLVERGVTRVAVSGSVINADSPKTVVQSLKSILNKIQRVDS